MKKFIILLVFAQLSFSQNILDLKSRADVIKDLQKDRLDNLLPDLMEETGIDMWVLITREYNEDPIIKTLLPPTWLNARRRTILVFFNNKGEIEKAAITRYNFGENIPSIWDKDKQPDQLKALYDYIKSKKPNKIGLNFSEHFALVDGISKTDFDLFYNNAPQKQLRTKLFQLRNLESDGLKLEQKKKKLFMIN